VVSVVWLLVMFDLPMKTKLDKRSYTSFRRGLLRRGFMRLQLSVYARPFGTDKSAIVANEMIVPPAGGEVRFLMVTDLQFGRMRSVSGGQKREPEKTWSQVVLF
jgi:CRISPR-associated protein Cas2